MLKTSLLAAAAVLSLSASAHATTMDMTLYNGGVTYGFGAPVKANIDLENANIKYDDAYLEHGENHTHVPKGHLYQNDYIDVTGGGHATIKLDGSFNTFGFKWGTIDKFNSLVVTDAAGNKFKITGADMLNYLVADGSKRDQSSVVITDPYANIVSVKFLSGQDSFEAANFFEGNVAVGAVPLPATSMLFAMALAGLAFLGWKKHQQG